MALKLCKHIPDFIRIETFGTLQLGEYWKRGHFMDLFCFPEDETVDSRAILKP